MVRQWRLPMWHEVTILLVDDDRDVCAVVEQILLAQNFNVLTAADGYEAIRILVSRRVDVMLTDLVMPGLSGYELAAQARLMQRSLRLLYFTGYDGQAPGKEMAAAYGKLLRKPIHASEIVSEIKGLLVGL
jgi:two-component system, sensor histidine kinase and response regulator